MTLKNKKDLLCHRQTDPMMNQCYLKELGLKGLHLTLCGDLGVFG
jgi:hypothetical protein